MPTFPYDPRTGKRLTRAGYFINPIQPMTQEEVDDQHDMVRNFLDSKIKPWHAGEKK